MQNLMKFWRETWWLWCLYLIPCILLCWFVSLFFLVMLPMLIIMFVYFALGRPTTP